ncbi:DUF1620-domain-containing protein [Nadsonia fulvescens var. elongata DSM 6958]|uniref:ER membrane protein complex subunit 1 n=1 Tax=Nadsonia fulvescens var. elongata DSM 6958 TaxID=857566 RepID=A0A1E3PCZ0_9ASCO|nr:DUF1620-domain-containing protein [Nadsonia fulvescens var. elongata DSM 6958]
MKPFVSLIFGLIGLVTLTSSVYVDEAFKTDWQLSHVGQLTYGNTVLLKDSVIAWTEANILASINSTNGELIWRKKFDEILCNGILIQSSSSSEYVNLALYDSSKGTSTISKWSISDGFLEYSFTIDGRVDNILSESSPNYDELILLVNAETSLVSPFSIDAKTGQVTQLDTYEVSSGDIDINDSQDKYAISSRFKDIVFTKKAVIQESLQLKLSQQANGIITLLKNEILQWEKDESLASIISSGFIGLAEKEIVSEDDLVYEETHDPLTAYIQRVKRHITALPLLVRYFESVLHSPFNLKDTSIKDLASNETDKFGFRKLLILTASNGKVFALDTFNQGNISWTTDTSEYIGKAFKSFTLDNSKVLVVDQELEAVLIDGLDGTVLTTYSLANNQPITDVFSIKSNSTVALFGTTETNEVVPIDVHELLIGDLVYFTQKVANTLNGYLYDPKSNRVSETWTFTPQEGHKIVKVASRDLNDMSASIGKTLADRSVLYKYLHPNMLAIATTSQEDSSLIISIIDSVTGRVLHSKIHNENVDTSSIVDLVFGEHWIVYSFSSYGSVKGQKVGVWDLYESADTNDRWSSSEAYSSFDYFPEPQVISQSYILPEKIKTLGITQTKYGITTRDVIMYLENGQVASVPKRALDPRRPVGEQPTKEQMQEEGLSIYAPLLRLDPKLYISHSRNILGNGSKGQIMSSATFLESTSLVVVIAGDGDIFFTRVTPSQPFDVLKPSFDKLKLFLTIGALVVGIRIVKPMVDRRQLNVQWGI